MASTPLEDPAIYSEYDTDKILIPCRNRGVKAPSLLTGSSSPPAKFKLHRFLGVFSLYFMFFASALIFFQPIPLVFAAQVTLTWDPNTQSDVAGYRIYYGPLSRQYSHSVNVGNQTSCTLSNLQDGNTYYFAATDYDIDGKESDFSNEVAFNAPLACTYSVSPANQSFGPQGGTGTLNITTTSGCNWTAVSNVSWLVVTSNSNVTGNGTANYSVSSSSSASARTGTLTVAGQSVTITQSGMASYTITASAGSNGSISPTGTVTVSSGGSQTFTITPNTNYKVADVKVDGVSKGAITSYTFQNVTSSHSISASFTTSSYAIYTITASAGRNGSISPQGRVTVSSGSSKTFTITPNANNRVADVKIDGVSKGAITSYTFNNVASNHSISASFAISSYTITASAGSNGSISPRGTVTVNSGGSQTFTITPNANYKVADVQVDGVSKGAITSYTFQNVTSNHSISASFSRKRRSQ